MKLPFSNFVPSTAERTGDATVLPNSSQDTSSSHLEKDVRTSSSRSPSVRSTASHTQKETAVETTAVGEAEALEKLNEEQEYPHGAKLNIITASLCLSVFLMALVCYQTIFRQSISSLTMNRTIQLSPPPSLRSQIISRRSTMSAGMARHIFSQHALSNCSLANSTPFLASSGCT